MNQLFEFLIAGLTGGLIVSSWNSYKDSPWENFSIRKFFRSPILGVLASIIVYVYLSLNNISFPNNFSTLVFMIITIERILGEAYKGFFRKNYHEEYKNSLKYWKLSFIANRYIKRILFGIMFILFSFAFFMKLTIFLYDHIYSILGKNSFGLVCGLLGGMIVAIAGMLKDVPHEGFKIKKFIRSPLAGIISGLLFTIFSNDLKFLFVSIPGMERITVESYKTFIKKNVRGIFENRKPMYKDWFRKRYVFSILFFVLVFIVFILMILD